MADVANWTTLQLLLSAMPQVTRAADSGKGWSPNAPRWPSRTYPRRAVASSLWDQACKRAGIKRRTKGPVDWALSLGELQDQAHSKGELFAAISSLFTVLQPRGGYIILQMPTVEAPALHRFEAHTAHGTWEWWQLQIETIADTLGYETTWLWRPQWLFQLMRLRLSDPVEVKELAPWSPNNVFMLHASKRLNIRERRSRWQRFKRWLTRDPR